GGAAGGPLRGRLGCGPAGPTAPLSRGLGALRAPVGCPSRWVPGVQRGTAGTDAPPGELADGRAWDGGGGAGANTPPGRFGPNKDTPARTAHTPPQTRAPPIRHSRPPAPRTARTRPHSRPALPHPPTRP
ncbi:hypothetical protein B8X03_09540, partial [Micrococcus luteus]